MPRQINISFPQRGEKNVSVNGKQFKKNRKFNGQQLSLIDVEKTKRQALADAKERRKLTGRPTRVVKLKGVGYGIFSR